MKKVVLLAASGFGLGYSPFASGTCGALLGIPLGLALTTFHGHLAIQPARAAAPGPLATPVCAAAAETYAVKDDGRIVADEYMLLPICFIGHAPLWRMIVIGGEAAWRALALVAVIFVISRVTDILKPSPARQIQAVRGGLGIVLDDLVADIYSWILIWGVSGYVLGPFANGAGV